jgi:hypothetical protein
MPAHRSDPARDAALVADHIRLRPEHATAKATDAAVAMRYRLSEGSVRRIMAAWRRRTGTSDDVPQDVIPANHYVKGVSTMLDMRTGEPIVQWIKTSREQEQWQEIVNAVLDSIPQRVTPRPAVKRKLVHMNDLLALYPLADLHIGLYSSLLDAERDWRLADTVALVKACIDDLVARTPQAAQAVVAQMGDFTHVDNMTNRTPNSGAPLDADGRFIEIAQAAFEVACYVIDRVAEHHQNVTVIWQSGNHDEASALVMQTALARIYKLDARVHVHQGGKRTHVLRHGRVALGFTHGDTIKAKALPLLMAADYPELWAATRYRVWHTGHIHHKTVLDEQVGCIVESHQSPAPRDAWHERSGYRSMQSMTSIVYDRVGEYARNLVQAHRENVMVDEQLKAA